MRQATSKRIVQRFAPSFTSGTRLHGTAPSYLAEMCTPVAASTGRRNLRSAIRSDLLVPRTRTITYGP